MADNPGLSATSSRRRPGCLIRLFIFALFLGACHWLFLAPLSDQSDDQTENIAVSESPTERLIVDGKINSTQRSILEELAKESGGQADVLVENGRIQYLAVNVQVPNSLAANAQGKATHFFQKNRELFQVQDPAGEFRVSGKSTNETGSTFIRYEQVYQGIPVYGSEVIIEVNDVGEINSLMAGYSPNLEINVFPEIRSIQAEEIALDDIGDPGGQLLVPTNLVIYDAKLIGETTPISPRLAWEVIVASTIELSIRSYLVDAQNGEILLNLDEIIGVRDRNVWDVQNLAIETSNPASPAVSFYFIFTSKNQVMDEDGPIKGTEPDEDAKRAWLHAGTVYDYYYDRFKRDGLDGKGGAINLYVNLRNCDISLWSPFFKKPLFCDGITSLDSVAHELTHGVWFSKGIRAFYKNEAAALNESFSDIFAAFIDDTDPWRITAEDTTQDNPDPFVYRDLSDPGSSGHLSHYSQYIQNAKNEQIYQNSTIHSYAVYLLSEGTPEGKPIDNIEVLGIGRSKAQYIYYDVMTNRLTYGVNFAQAQKATIASCKKLIGVHGISTSDCDQVMNAYASVGIGEPAANLPPPVQIPLPDKIEDWWNDLVYNFRENLRELLNDLLGKWSPIILWQRLQDFNEELRNNYWIKLLECIKESDKACIEQYLTDLLNEIIERFLLALNEACLSITLIPITLLALRVRKRLAGG